MFAEVAIRALSVPVSEVGSGRPQRAPGNVAAGVSLEHIGAGDLESDTGSPHKCCHLERLLVSE